MDDGRRTYRGISADERRERRRALLLDACLDLVGASGLLAVSAESVSSQAKLTKRYFYESYTDRDAILVAALDMMFVELVANVHDAIAGGDAAARPNAIAEVFVSALCADPRRARLYAESPAIPALQAKRTAAITAFTELLTVDRHRSSTARIKRQLMTRVVVAGVTEVVTSWIGGTLTADRTVLTDAISTLGHIILSDA